MGKHVTKTASASTNTYSKCPIFHFTRIGISEAPNLKLKDVLKFMAGCETIPPMGFPCDLNVHFRHGCPDNCQCRPTASTCALVLILPNHSCSSKEIGDLLISCLIDCCGFGNL